MEEKIQETREDAREEEAILPTGWAEGDDLFDVSSWSGAAEAAPGGDSAAPLDLSEGKDTDLPTTEEETRPANKWKFSAKVDHQVREVELDENELPDLYQKAQATQRAQQRLAELNEKLELTRRLAADKGFHDLEELLGAEAPASAAAEGYGENAPGSHHVNERDFTAEARELLKIYPGLRGSSIPTEVVMDSLAKDQPLMTSFAAYREKQHEKEVEALRRESQILKQNAAAAARAPVQGVARGGSGKNEPEDPFIRGFESDGW